MFAEERQQAIAELIKMEGKVHVKALAELYGVTMSTIRNDLTALEDRGILIRTYGGATLFTNEKRYEIEYDSRKRVNELGKLRIGKWAAGLIKNNQTVLLDTGTTTYHIAKHLHDREGLTVLTNDFEIAMILEIQAKCEVFFLGGAVKSGYHCTYHNYFDAIIKDMSVDIAFMGANSINVNGIYVADQRLADTKKLMVKQAEHAFVCADISKFNKKSIARFATFHDINAIVTDDQPENIVDYKNVNAEIIVV